VTILRERHPFEGRVLLALGAVHRRGVALLLVVLPDGSRSLIPAGWTDLAAMPVAEPTRRLRMIGTIASPGLSISSAHGPS
jgi:hypothetical protein